LKSCIFMPLLDRILSIFGAAPATLRFALLALFLFCAEQPVVLAQAPVASLSPSKLSFTYLVGGPPAVQSVTVTNTGNADLIFSSIVVTGTNSSSFAIQSSSTCTVTNHVAAGQKCTVAIGFSNSKAGGPFGKTTLTATLSVSDNASGSPQSVPLSGTTTLYAAFISANYFIFGVQGVGTSSPVKMVNLTNAGTTALTISGVTISGDFTQTNNCPSNLATQATCTIKITFKPSVAGTRTGWLMVNDNSNGSPQYVQFTGVGASGTASVSTSSLAFGSQLIGTSSSTPQTVTLTNSGPGSLAIVSISASGDYAQTNNCGTSLAAGANCTIGVTFTPTWSGTRLGAINIGDTDASNLQMVALTGKGQAPATTVTLNAYQVALTLSQKYQFQANLGVNWSVDGVVGGSSQSGTITAVGLYTAPNGPGTHQITGTSLSDATQIATATVYITTYGGTYTFHNDNLRTGQNLNETVLSPANVNSTQCGFLFSYKVDGHVYAQPLYVPNVNIPSVGKRNVLYIATEHDSVYALDADGLTTKPYWHVSVISPPTVTTLSNKFVHSTVFPEVGITSTPVIDPTTSTIYFVANTLESNNSVYRLHALDMTTGAEKFGGPVQIDGAVPGTGIDAQQGMVTFNNLREGQRPGLLLSNGVIYIAFADRGPDTEPYHGWLFGYDAQSLQQVSIFNTTPNGFEGGIWEDGNGLGADASGNIFVSSGNGSSDGIVGGDFGDSILKFSTTNGLAVSDFFTPFDQAYLTKGDLDLSSGGVVLLPDQSSGPAHLLVGAGKEGVIYLINRDNMGGAQSGSDTQIQQSIRTNGMPQIFSTPAFWQNHLYYIPLNGTLEDFRLYNGFLSPTPLATSSSLTPGEPGSTPVVSSNGTSNGIVWALDVTPGENTQSGAPAILHAWDAYNIATELYNTSQAGTRDTAPLAVKFTVPTVANGKVYVGGQKQVNVYGLLTNVSP
jgi:hypothetical protein